MVEIVAHRGSSGKFPENTMRAFIEAEKTQVDGIEMDVRFTKDKELVVIHDETVDRTTDGRGKVSEYTLHDLKKLNAAANYSQYDKEEILTLKEYLDWASATNLTLYIELKYSKDTYQEYESDVLALLNEYDINDRLIISSFNPQGLKKLAKLAPELKLGLLYSKKIKHPDRYIKKLGIDYIHPSKKITDKKLVKKALKNKIPIRVYTLNSEKEIKKYLKMNCSAIITDYPKRALSLRKQMVRRRSMSCSIIVVILIYIISILRKNKAY